MTLHRTLKTWLKRPAVVCLLLGLMLSLAIFIVQSTGILQGLELRAFDQLLLKRPETKIDERIVIIEETEFDLRRYGHPLSDQVLGLINPILACRALSKTVLMGKYPS